MKRFIEQRIFFSRMEEGNALRIYNSRLISTELEYRNATARLNSCRRKRLFWEWVYVKFFKGVL